METAKKMNNGRLEDDMFVFPRFCTRNNSKHLNLYFFESLSDVLLMKIANSLLRMSNAITKDQKLTTHAFRRTGANILAFYQQNGAKWNLSLVRSFCGWTALSESEMMTRYLVHKAHHLEDESLEAFNPYMSHKNIIIEDAQILKSLDYSIQKSVTSAVNQVLKLQNVDVDMVSQMHIQSKTNSTTASIATKGSKTNGNSQSSLFPNLRTNKSSSKSATQLIENAWCTGPYNIRELCNKYSNASVILSEKDYKRLKEWQKVGHLFESMSSKEFHSKYLQSNWTDIKKAARLYCKEKAIVQKRGRKKK